MSWTYFSPTTDTPAAPIADSRAVRMLVWPSIPYTVGASELKLMLRARQSGTHTLCLGHTRAQNTTRLAARRLVARGLLNEPNAMRCPRGFNNPAAWLYFYTLTERGRTCWLRTRRDEKGGQG